MRDRLHGGDVTRVISVWVVMLGSYNKRMVLFSTASSETRKVIVASSQTWEHYYNAGRIRGLNSAVGLTTEKYLSIVDRKPSFFPSVTNRSIT